jgi:hypothetical protein
MKIVFENITIAKLSFYIIVSIIFSCPSVSAQPIKNHRIGFHLGFGFYETRDNLVSPLIYSGNKFPFRLYYKYEGLENRHCVNISYNSGKINSSVNNWADEWAAGFSYGYHRFILSFLNNDGKLFIGGIFNNYFSYKSYYFRSYDPYLNYYTDTNTWELISSISLSFLGEYQLNKGDKIAFQIILPVIANVIRPSYSILPPDNILRLKDPTEPSFGDIINAGNVVTIDKYFLINFLISYEINISDYFNLRWNYSFKYYRITNPLKTNSVVNEFGVDILLLL